MKFDIANEALCENEVAERFEYDRINRRDRIEHSFSVVMFGRRFMLSVRLH